MTDRAFIADAREATGLHDGSMTCLVRAVDPQPKESARYPWRHSRFVGVNNTGAGMWVLEADPVPRNQFGGVNIHTSRLFACPFGVVGDRLFVQEDYIIAQTGHSTLNGAGGKVSLDPATLYRADGHDTVADAVNHVRGMTDVDGWEAEYDTWRFAEGAPRKASRTLLDVTDVRVVRLDQVTGEDMVAAGLIKTSHYGAPAFGLPGWVMDDYLNVASCVFRRLVTDDIKANPWLWLATVAKTEEVSA